MTLGEFVAVNDLCFGLAGFVLGVLNYRKLVAQISDTTGKVWISKSLNENEVPSWAKAAK